MYRDDPLDDEADLRAVLGDAAVDDLAVRGGADAVGAAVDLLRLAQGWVDDTEVAGWFGTAQRRLGDRTPLAALVEGRTEEAADALRSWLAARG